MKKQQGYNHNIRYCGVLFHVQTEDYGFEIHKIVTQLFHGGQLIAKKEQDYQSVLAQENAEEKIIAMMKKQHKSMLQELTEGMIAFPTNIQKLLDES